MNDQLSKLAAGLTRDEAWNLSVSEKDLMRASILARIDVLRRTPVVSPYISYFLRRNALIAAALIVALLGGSSSVALAGESLPGDVLYPLKTDVAEPLERVFALGKEARALVETRQAEERLREVALLAADERPELSDAALRAAERIAKARARVDTLGSEDASQRFSFALLAQAEVLEAQAKGEEEDEADSLSALARAAREGERALSASTERAGELLAKAREKLLTRDLEEDTRAELLAELSRLEERFAAATLGASVPSLIAVERSAYRVMALADAVERIRDTGRKGVLVRFREHEEARSAKSAAPEPALMMASEAVSDDSSPEEEDEEEDRVEEETELEFRVLDLDGDEEREKEEEEEEDTDEDRGEDEDHSGKGGG